ncbi:ATP-binding cassette domain-containing protein [Anaerorhabdus sp.]|uniref:ATP-binding cassette domain-containing protein n=1 Tax=Anaerorhabdus sp. TaxID=1872524 RepID=UPI002FC77325
MEIKIENLSKSYGKLEIFKDYNLKIESGKITCLYGESGCGKTTILNIIGLIENYQKGSIYYDGQVIKKEKDIRSMHKEKIGFIFQDFGLIENMTVKENLNIVQKIRVMKNKNEVMNDTLKDLNLECVLDKKVFELSGGEQQRVAIAKLLLKDPDLILADEPTASLDENNQQLILNLMRQICEQGKTIIIVSHDAATREFADIKIDLTKEKENRK